MQTLEIIRIKRSNLIINRQKTHRNFLVKNYVVERCSFGKLKLRIFTSSLLLQCDATDHLPVQIRRSSPLKNTWLHKGFRRKIRTYGEKIRARAFQSPSSKQWWCIHQASWLDSYGCEIAAQYAVTQTARRVIHIHRLFNLFFWESRPS